MTRNIVVTMTIMAVLAIVAAAVVAIPAFVTPTFALFDTNNIASQSASTSLNAGITNTNTGGSSTNSISQSSSICQQIAQSGAFGSSTNTGCS